MCAGQHPAPWLVREHNRPDPADVAARFAERDQRPPANRDLTARMMGDPEPWRKHIHAPFDHAEPTNGVKR
jgi:hypothetical protein